MLINALEKFDKKLCDSSMSKIRDNVLHESHELFLYLDTCVFVVAQIDYLSHLVSCKGKQPSQEQI